MVKCKDELPEEFQSLEEAADFWDAHSASDYWDEMEDVEIEVDIKERRFVISLEEAVYRAVEEKAAAEHISTEKFINEFLRRELIGSQK